jgi:hypothetical protein
MVFFSKWRFWGLLGLGLLVLALLVGHATPLPALQALGQRAGLPAGAAAPVVDKARAGSMLSQLPLYFERNDGQAGRDTRFLSRTAGFTLLLNDNETVFSLVRGPHAGAAGSKAASGEVAAAVVRARLDGARHAPAIVGEAQTDGHSNYFIGNDASHWHRDVPQFGRVRYQGVYPGVDVVYYGNQHQLEYDFVLAPGADARPIRLSYHGAESLRLDDKGSLVIATPLGDMVQHAPVAYQTIDGVRRTVAARFQLDQRSNAVSFALADYDHSRALVIDPVLTYAAVAGDAGDYISGIAVDSSGVVYISSIAYGDSLNATAGTFQTSNKGTGYGTNVFVTAFTPGTTANVKFATFLGGSASCRPNATALPCAQQSDESDPKDFPTGLAIDGAGKVYLTGAASSSDFPLLHPVQGSNKAYATGGTNAFVSVLSASGNQLVYSTYLGGSGSGDMGKAIAVYTDPSDLSTHAYVAGFTGSSDLSASPGVVQGSQAGQGDAFVARFSAGGVQEFLTLLGGSGYDSASGIAVDGTGAAYVSGFTKSANFPTATPMQAQNNHSSGGSNAFVAKLNSSATQLVYSTYLGGTGNGAAAGDVANGIAIDNGGNAYVTGAAYSTPQVVVAGSNTNPTTGFPVTANTFQTTNNAAAVSGFNAFVTELDASGQHLVYSTYIGGSGQATGTGDAGAAIALDAGGNAFVAGSAQSLDFPVLHAYQASNRTQSTTGSNAIAFQLAPGGQSLVYSTYIGGGQTDAAYAVAVDQYGYTYLAGSTSSSNFTATQGTQSLASYSFVAVLSAEAPPVIDLQLAKGDTTVASAVSSGAVAASGCPGGSTAQAVAAGCQATLSWIVRNAVSCQAQGAWTGSQPVSGALVLSPTVPGTYTYTLQCSGEAGTSTASVTLTVENALPVIGLGLSQTTVNLGGSAQLSWWTQNATSCDASGDYTASNVGTSGSITVTPTVSVDQTYTLTCTGPGGAAPAKSITLTVLPQLPAVSLTTMPLGTTEIAFGQPITLSWSSVGVDSCVGSSSPVQAGWDGVALPTASTGLTLTPTVAGNIRYAIGCHVAGTPVSSTAVGGAALLTVDPPPAPPAQPGSKKKKWYAGSGAFDLLGLFGVMTVLRRRRMA